MNGKIDAFTNDRSDRQLEMLQLWQDSIQQNQENLKRVNDTSGASEAEIREKIRNGEIDCPTCKSRTYVDQSDDSGVSFQTPTNISPGQSMAAVVSHEREHVVRNRAEALAEGREVTHSSVSLQYATCPTCGARYVAGGLTRTVTQAMEDQKQNPFEKGIFNIKV